MTSEIVESGDRINLGAVEEILAIDKIIDTGSQQWLRAEAHRLDTRPAPA